jgi:hypothetical protein
MTEESKDLRPGNENAGDNVPPSESKQSVKPDQQLLSRPAPLVWFSVCLGLYLGALLYGKKFLTLSLAVHAKRSQVSTLP